MKSLLGNFNRHLAIFFWSHCHWVWISRSNLFLLFTVIGGLIGSLQIKHLFKIGLGYFFVSIQVGFVYQCACSRKKVSIYHLTIFVQKTILYFCVNIQLFFTLQKVVCESWLYFYLFNFLKRAIRSLFFVYLQYFQTGLFCSRIWTSIT